MDASVDPFDLSAAYLRRAQGDMTAFMAGLAARLEGALPGVVAVTRRRNGLFSSETHVTAITATTDRTILSLTLVQGRLQARRAKVVRGVTIGSEEIAIPVWLEELARSIGEVGASAEATRASLHDFLLS